MVKAKALLILGVGFVLGLVFLMTGSALWSDKVHAKAEGDIGRYQISSWASYSGEKVHHSGYYIMDTTTGKIVDQGHEIHGIGSDSRPR